MSLFKNKKAGIAADDMMAALTTIIILLLLMGIFWLVMYMGRTEVKGDVNEDKYDNNVGYLLHYFLRKPVMVEGKEITIADIVSMVDVEEGKEQRIKTFQETAKEIFKEHYPLDHPKWEGVHPWWIRVYDAEEKPTREGNGRYFKILSKGYTSGGANCDPKEIERNFVINVMVPKANGGYNKVVFCIFKSYLRKTK